MIGLKKSRGWEKTFHVSLHVFQSHGHISRYCSALLYVMNMDVTSWYRFFLPCLAQLRWRAKEYSTSNQCFFHHLALFQLSDYNKQLTAQLVRRHEDLFNPENSCLLTLRDISWVEQIYMSPFKLGNKCILFSYQEHMMLQPSLPHYGTRRNLISQLGFHHAHSGLCTRNESYINLVIFAGRKLRNCVPQMLHVVVIFTFWTKTPSYLQHGVIST